MNTNFQMMKRSKMQGIHGFVLSQNILHRWH